MQAAAATDSTVTFSALASQKHSVFTQLVWDRLADPDKKCDQRDSTLDTTAQTVVLPCYFAVATIHRCRIGS